MSLFQNPNPQNLNEWLEMAAKKLVSQARLRVWGEVTSHYEEAVEGHLQNGLPIAAAQEAALAELGDAKAADRRFRRTHLTEREFRKVDRLLKSYQPSLWVHVNIVFGSLCLGSVLAGGFRHGVPVSILWVVVVVLFIGLEAVAFVLSRHKSPRRVVQMEMGGTLMMGAAYTCILHTGPVRGWPEVCMLLCYLCLLGSILNDFRLSSKLGKVAEDWMGESVAARNEIPPDKPVAS